MILLASMIGDLVAFQVLDAATEFYTPHTWTDNCDESLLDAILNIAASKIFSDLHLGVLLWKLTNPIDHHHNLKP